MKGWRITIGVGAGLLALTALQLLLWGTGEEGIRVLVRSTARSSVVLFALAFGASGLRRLWRSELSAWILAQRRYLGVSYAVSHGLHAAALVALYRVSDEFAGSLDALTLVGGGLAYVFTVAMALTSSDAAVAALGRRRWTLLHRSGSWYIWIIFAQSYLPRAVLDPAYLPAGAIVLGVAAIRLVAWSRTRTRRASPA